VIRVLSWFAALFIGRLPRFAAEFLPGFVRWVTRVTSYFYLMTDKYPPFTLEDDATYPVRVSLQPGPLNRWAVLFRIILIIPASIVSGVVQNGTSSLVAFVTWLIVLVNGSMPPALFQALSAAPVPPTLPGVAFTFGGPGYLWGYTDDRSHCGIWSATDLTAPPQMWPIGDQGEGWARFRDLEPNAVALADPTPPPAA